VTVLGEAAAASLFGADDPVGRYVKVNEQWFQVIGVAGPQLTVQSEVAGLPAQDRNNLMYVPLYSAIFRLEDGQSQRPHETVAAQLRNHDLAKALEGLPWRERKLTHRVRSQRPAEGQTDGSPGSIATSLE